MRRRIFAFTSAVSLLLGLTTVVLWVAHYLMINDAHFQKAIGTAGSAPYPTTGSATVPGGLGLAEVGNSLGNAPQHTPYNTASTRDRIRTCDLRFRVGATFAAPRTFPLPYPQKGGP